jgi:hypothetical protein
MAIVFRSELFGFSPQDFLANNPSQTIIESLNEHPETPFQGPFGRRGLL